MNLSDQEKICLAKAVANGGTMNTFTIKNVYSQSVDVKSKLQTFEAKGYITKISDNPVRFRLKLKEVEDKVVFDISHEIVQMGKNIRESRNNKDKQKELYRRLENE